MVRFALLLALLAGLGACDGSTPRAAERPAPGPAEPAGSAEGPPTRLLGGLSTVLLGGTDGHGGGDGPVVVLLHGYGAAGDDLVPLARRLSLPRAIRVVVPAAPIDLGGGGRAWWPLDVDRLRRASERDLSGEVPDGMASSRRKVLALVRDLGVPPPRVALVGFSQGAMLALDVALHMEPHPAAVAALSGTLLAEAEWVPRMRARPDLRVLVSHGRSDPLLPFAMAERLRDRLEGAGLTVTWVPFDGGHTIPAQVTGELSAFLAPL